MKVIDLVALHPTCTNYNMPRVDRDRLSIASKRHDDLLRRVFWRLSEIRGLLCFEGGAIVADLGVWGRVVGKADAICLKIGEGQRLGGGIVIEVKSYRGCGLCEKMQLALYIAMMVLRFGIKEVSGLLICGDRGEIIRLEDLLKPGLYEELSKILRVSTGATVEGEDLGRGSTGCPEQGVQRSVAQE